MDTAPRTPDPIPPQPRGGGIRSETARWVDAGLITPAQAREVVEFEQARRPARAPVVAEVLAYLGAALVTAAVATLVASRWSDLGAGFQLALLAGAATIGIAGGALARGRHRPEFDRVTTVLWLAALAAIGGFTAVAAGDGGLDLDDDTVGLAVAGAVAAAAIVLYGFHRTALQLLAVIGATTAFVALTITLTDTESGLVFGPVLIVIGSGWLLQSLRPVLRPGPVAFVAGGAIAYLGTSVLAGEWMVVGLGLGVLGAVGVVLLSLRTRSLVHLFTGAVGLFVTLPRFAVELFGESVGAPLALLAVGVLVIGVAVLAGRLHRRDGGSPGPLPAGT